MRNNFFSYNCILTDYHSFEVKETFNIHPYGRDNY